MPVNRSRSGPSGGISGIGGGDGGRKPGTKVCPTCHGSGRVPSGGTGSVKGKPDRVKRPGARSMKKPAAKKTRR